MFRRICFGISIILSIAMCLALLCFPVLEFNQENVEKYNQLFINDYIEQHKGEASDEVLKQEAIEYIIDITNSNLRIHGDVSELVQDEDGNWISQGIDEELRKQELERIKNNGVKYRDLANGIKNQCTYDIKLYNSIKSIDNITNQEKSAAYFKIWINPFPFIGIVLLISLEFASAFLVIIRSIKGILGKKRTKLFTISVFGCLISLFLLLLPRFFGKELIEGCDMSYYSSVFMTNVKGSQLVYYSFFGFLVCSVISILTKFLKPE